MSESAGIIRVLLADQERLIRNTLAALLDLEEGIEVVAEVGGANDVAMAVVEHAPDVAVLDIDLLGTDTLGAADWLFARCRVVILTSLGPPGHLRRAMAVGARGFLGKDVPVAELATAIHRVHAGDGYLDASLAATVMAAWDNPLTEDEREVLRLASAGTALRDIARSLRLTEGRIRDCLSVVMIKLEARSRFEAIQMAQRMGWL